MIILGNDERSITAKSTILLRVDRFCRDWPKRFEDLPEDSREQFEESLYGYAAKKSATLNFDELEIKFNRMTVGRDPSISDDIWPFEIEVTVSYETR